MRDFMTCPDCEQTGMRNWTTKALDEEGLEIPHHYCKRCGTRIFRGQIYSAKEWYTYINKEKV